MTPGLDVPGRRDAGLSLVELLVTMVIAGIVLPLVFAVVIAAQRQTTGTIGAADGVAAARLGLQLIDREVRSGAAPVYVDGTRSLGFATEFASDRKPAAKPRCVQYRIAGGNLQVRAFPVEATTRPAWPSASLVSNLTTGSGFAKPNPASVSVTLVVAGGASGRAADQRLETIQSVLTVRNPPLTPDTAACGNFS